MMVGLSVDSDTMWVIHNFTIISKIQNVHVLKLRVHEETSVWIIIIRPFEFVKK